jgi:LPS export ABC transporter permease LptG/LPS export ABC transporter permease LptF
MNCAWNSKGDALSQAAFPVAASNRTVILRKTRMLKTIDRYVIREVVPPFLLALLIFTFILELPPLMEEMERLVAKGVPWMTVGHIILLLLPQALGLTIPMALLVGLLIGLGRMSTDRESVALLACGVSPYRLLRPVMALALVAAAATMYVMIEALPDSNQRYRQILFDIISKRVESDVQPRVFYQQFPNWTLYPRDEAAAGQTGWRDLMVANTSKPEAPEIYLASRGRVVLNAKRRTVELVLTDGTQYSAGGPGEANTMRFTEQLTLRLDPDTVFPPLDIARGLTEKTIVQLREDIAAKTQRGESPHNEYMAIHAKFSIPVACLVFAVIALALGMTVARGGKLGGFVVGIGVIFAYYIAMFLAESLAKGHRIPAEWARWVPNLLLGPFGIVALILRARHAEGRLPFNLKIALPARPAWLGGKAATASPAASTAGRRTGVVLVIRIPRLAAPMPGLLDRYISKMYLRVAGLSFLALLGLFYISTFIDRSDKMFKGQATASMIGQLLVMLTPQFIYYVIPIAALLSVLVTFGLLARSSELTVMKACGVSLYRTALSVIILSLGFSVVLFALEQRLMATANREAETLDALIRGRQPKTRNILNRQWVMGPDNTIYHYGAFDPERNELFRLTMFKLDPKRWALATETFVHSAVYANGQWTGKQGWVQDFTKSPATWTPIAKSPLPALEEPKYFTTEKPDAEFMTVGELGRYIKELEASGFNTVPLKVDLQRKFAFPFVTLVMTLLAIPFGVSVGRHGALYGIGLGIVIALCYWILISAFVAIGRAGLLPPMLAGWAPNILVMGVAGYLFLRART